MTEFRTPGRELARFRLRVVVAMLFVCLCLGLLATRFYYLQVLRHEYYLTRAEDNRIALLPVVPHRGTIVDRNGVVLARNYATYTLEIMPSEVRDLEGTLAELSTLVPIEPRDLRRFRKLFEESRNFESVPVRSRLTDEEVARVVSQRYRLPGVDVRARLLRDYPQGTTAAHVVGYIGRINERDVERIEERGQTANYRGTLHIGKAGLEQSYEAELHGTTGVEQVCIHFGKPNQQALDTVDVATMTRYMQEGHFPPGSMLPKIVASLAFLERGGKRVIITTPECLPAALRGETGTHIVHS